MPIYEFECAGCGGRFEELVPAGTATHACPQCGGSEAPRRLSAVSPPPRLASGARVRDGEKRRGEREDARRERLADTKKKRAGGELPAGGGGGS